MAVVYCQYWFKWVTHYSTGQLSVPIWPDEDAFGIFLNCCSLKLLAWKKGRVFLSNTAVLLVFQSYISDNRCVQVDPTGSGRVAAADAALFLKRSGLADLVLGKVRKESDQCISVSSLLSVLFMLMLICISCMRVHRSGIWQTLNEKVLSTSRYDCTAASRHNGFVCVCACDHKNYITCCTSGPRSNSS